MQDRITTTVLTAKGGFVVTGDAAEWLTGYPVRNGKPLEQAEKLAAYMRGCTMVGDELDKRHGPGGRPDGGDCRHFAQKRGEVSIALILDIARSQENALLVEVLLPAIARREAALGYAPPVHDARYLASLAGTKSLTPESEYVRPYDLAKLIADALMEIADPASASLAQRQQHARVTRTHNGVLVGKITRGELMAFDEYRAETTECGFGTVIRRFDAVSHVAKMGLVFDAAELRLQKAPCDTPHPPEQEAAAPAPVVAALEEVNGKAGPQPVPTSAMAASFAGLHWDGKQWLKTLGNKPKWLNACLVLGGARGESMRQWNPVLIGAHLVRMGYVKANSVRAKFQSQDALKPWLDEWKTYEADNFQNQ